MCFFWGATQGNYNTNPGNFFLVRPPCGVLFQTSGTLRSHCLEGGSGQGGPIPCLQCGFCLCIYGALIVHVMSAAGAAFQPTAWPAASVLKGFGWDLYTWSVACHLGTHVMWERDRLSRRQMLGCDRTDGSGFGGLYLCIWGKNPGLHKSAPGGVCHHDLGRYALCFMVGFLEQLLCCAVLSCVCLGLAGASPVYY